MMKVAYLMHTTPTSVQKNNDAIAMMFSGVVAGALSPRKHWRNAYNGLVAMSPKTTPNAPRASLVTALGTPPRLASFV